ncbi:MAG: glycosyltransferase family 2 protein [Rickettsiales bacterium]|nr:glycosyltransferase family 2 protein [Rickettsiales bacterium]
MMMSIICGVIAVISAVLIVYHHLIWPILIVLLARKKADTPSPNSVLEISNLPEICIIIPIYNEAEFIAEKLWNCAMLDYPAQKLRIQLICDGCSDGTTTIARDILKNPLFDRLPIFLEIHKKNRGKQRVVEEAIKGTTESIIVLSDCSALLSIDSLKRIATQFQDERVGVVCATYRLLQPGSLGEKAYWRYQKHIKRAESKLENVLGAHGACYAFRRKLYTPLPPQTINDDFVLPMQIVKQGYRAIYDEEVVAVEMEQAPESFDFHRRIRLSAGNIQQCSLLVDLLHPRYGMTALSFFSGKFLRAIMPYLMIFAFIGSGIAALNTSWSLLLFIPQVLLYALTALSTMLNTTQGKLASLRYLVLGHLAGLIGTWRYFFTPQQLHWQETST